MDFKKDIYQDPDIRKYVKIISRDPRAFASLGNALLSKGYVEDAIEVCQEGLENDPDFTAGRAVLGKCYVKDGKTELALGEFESILDKSHDNVVALKGLGEIYYSLERYQDAREMYDRLLFIDPMNSDFQEMSEKIANLISSGGAAAAPKEAAAQDEPESASVETPQEDAGPEEPPVTAPREMPSFARKPEPAQDESVEYVEEKTVFEMINHMKLLTSLSERVMASGFNAQAQTLFSRMYALFGTETAQRMLSDLDAYLNMDGDEGEIIPIERGVSPHEGESLEIAGTENIGLQEPPVESLEDKVESADSIVSNEELSYQDQQPETGESPDDEMAYMEKLIDKSIKEGPSETIAVEEEVNEISYSSQEDAVPPGDAELDTTLKGKDNFDMEMQETAEDIPVNEIPEDTDQNEPVEEIPEDTEQNEPVEEISEDMEQDESVEEITDEISEDEELDEEIEDVIEEDEMSEAIPFRDDSYESLEDEISKPQDLNALMAEAEKSISGDDESPEADILDELEEETASYQMERENESFSGEKVLSINEATAPPDVENMDKFKGHSEVEVGEISTDTLDESQFSGKEEIDVAQEHIAGVSDDRFARNEPIDVDSGAIPRESAPEEEIRDESFAGSSDLAMDDVDLDSGGKALASDDESLLDADEEKIDDISKWLNEL